MIRLGIFKNVRSDKIYGLYYILFSWFLLGSMGLATRAAAVYGFTTGPIVLARTLTQLLGGILLAVVLRQAWSVKNLNALIFLGVFGGAGVLTFSLSLQGTTAARATILNYTFIPISNLIALALDKDRPSPIFWISFVAGGLGLWIILDPLKIGFIAQNQSTLPGDAWGLLSGFCAGAYVYMLKRQRGIESSFSVYLIYSAFAFIYSLPAFWLGNITPSYNSSSELTLLSWVALFSVGLLALAGHLFNTLAFKSVSLETGTICALIAPVTAAAGGWLLLEEPLSFRLISGGLLVLMSCLLTGFYESKRTKNHRIDERFSKTSMK